jgi:hypothetical protein
LRMVNYWNINDIEQALDTGTFQESRIVLSNAPPVKTSN